MGGGLGFFFSIAVLSRDLSQTIVSCSLGFEVIEGFLL